MRYRNRLIIFSMCSLAFTACSESGDQVSQQVVEPPPSTPPTAAPPVATPAQSTVTVVDGSGSGVFDVGSTVEITANAPMPGEEFSQWVGDTDTIEDTNSARTMLSVPDSDITVSATFSALPGLLWRPLQEPSIGGRVDSIGISPHDQNLVLIGGDLLGVGRSVDGGETWQSTSGFLSWEISDFAFHPTDPDIIWVGTLSGPHLSEDGGVTWTPMREGLPEPEFGRFTAPVERILFEPVTADGSRLLAFGGDHRSFSDLAFNFGAVYRSENSGETWTQISTVGNDANIVGVDYAGGSQTTLWAATATQGIFINESSGDGVWTPRNNGLPLLLDGVEISGIAPDINDPDTAFVTVNVPQGDSAFSANFDGAVYRTTNGGLSWEQVLLVPSAFAPSSFRHIRASEDGSTLYAVSDSFSGARGVHRSTDGGDTWVHVLSQDNADAIIDEPTPFGGNDAIDLWWVEIDPNDAARLFVAGSQSALESETSGNNWTDASGRSTGNGRFQGGGYGGWVASNVEWNPYNSDMLVAQGLDAGITMITDPAELSWLVRQPGLPPFSGGQDAAFLNDGETLFAALGQFGFADDPISRSTDGGETWEAIEPPAGLEAVTAFFIHANPADGNRAWVVMDNRLFFSANALDTAANVTWSELDVFNGETVRVIEAAPSSGDTFFVATDAGIWRTENGADFTFIGGPAGGEFSSLAVDPQDPDIIYGAVNNSVFGDQGLWRVSVDPAVEPEILFINTPEEQAISSWIRDITVDPTSSDMIAFITDQNPFNGVSDATGVWISNDGGATWEQENNGLRLLRGQTISFNTDGDQLAVGLNGGGFAITDIR